MKYVAVLPYAYPPYLAACRATMHPDLQAKTLFIDDSSPVGGIGIMKAHNMGIDYMKQEGADYLIIISAAVRFGAAGGLDFIEQIEKHQDYQVIHAASENVKGGKQQDGGGGHNEVFGWHLTAFRKDVFETIGRWDENFTPYGFDDIDLSLRIRKGMPHVKWDTFPCDVHDSTMSHSINLAGVESPSAPRILYFTEKWGRHPGAWQWDGWEHPFNNPEHSLSYWPPAPNGDKWDD